MLTKVICDLLLFNNSEISKEHLANFCIILKEIVCDWEKALQKKSILVFLKHAGWNSINLLFKEPIKKDGNNMIWEIK